ncbi:protein SLOW WALKER 1-like [Forsythia ovata]|uniref:Protein SLOW WALKER 1-like n=1 Tax=Forsythia ovata TaxID=205694 RepID=A0ABD1P8H5_9LAMI
MCHRRFCRCRCVQNHSSLVGSSFRCCTTIYVVHDEDSSYWKSFKHTLSPIAHHDFAATHSANVTIFFGKTLEPKSTIASTFSNSATSVAYRYNGKLLAVGDLTGTELQMDPTPVEDGGFKCKIGSDGGEIGELHMGPPLEYP